MSYRAWVEFTGAIRTGQGSGFVTRLDPETQRVFSAGVESATADSAVALADCYEFGRHRRLAGEWLMGRGEGDVYSEDEICHLLTVTGWTMIARRPLTGPASLVVAEREGHDGIAHDS